MAKRVLSAVAVSSCMVTVGLLFPASATAAPKTGPASLPVGPATSYVFGFTKSDGAKLSLQPPNLNDVAQGLVKTTKKMGPFVINMSKSFAGWPNACSLINVNQLRHLFPAVKSLHGAPVATKGEIIGGTGGKTPHPVDCKINLNTTFQPAGYGNTVSWVDVNIQEADTGTPQIWTQTLQTQKVTARKYPAEYASYPSMLGGTKCFYDGNGLECLKGDIDFWVDGQKVTGGILSSVDQAVWIDQMIIPVAEVVASELRSVQ